MNTTANAELTFVKYFDCVMASTAVNGVKLDITSKALYCLMLNRYEFFSGKGNEFYDNQEYMAGRLDLSVSTVKRSIGKLIEAKLISKTSKRTNNGISNIYKVVCVNSVDWNGSVQEEKQEQIVQPEEQCSYTDAPFVYESSSCDEYSNDGDAEYYEQQSNEIVEVPSYIQEEDVMDILFGKTPINNSGYKQNPYEQTKPNRFVNQWGEEDPEDHPF